MQDEFNKFITNKGYNLDRGNLVANVQHQTKLEYQIKKQKAELCEILEEKYEIIKEQKSLIENLNSTIVFLKHKLYRLKKKYLTIGHNLAKKLNINPKNSIKEYDELLKSMKEKDRF
ncbi:MAG: hypothetical protein R3Y13_06000 [bacterium]